MKALIDAIVRTFEWLQPRSLVDYYELRAGEEMLGRLWFEGFGGFTANATAVHGAWRIEQAGVLDERLVVRDSGTGEKVAVYSPRLLGDGVLEIIDGQKFRWEPANFWMTDWRFVDEIGNELLTLKDGVSGAKLRDILKNQATVSVENCEWGPRVLEMLASVGWYLVLTRRRKAVAATAAT